MKVVQSHFNFQNGWRQLKSDHEQGISDLVLVFASRELAKNAGFLEELKKKFPSAIYCGCSTSGEICDTQVCDQSASVIAVKFEKTTLLQKTMNIEDASHSFDAGLKLISSFPHENLRHVFVLSDGLHVNGSELVRGLRQSVPAGVSITGGLAGDGSDFKETYVIDADGTSKQNIVNAIAFYGEHLKVGYGSFGGWDSFGIERLVTKSEGNVLYELDHQPALELYKSFLGAEAANLPASGLLFPLSLRYNADQMPVVRTILAVDENRQSLTFAGDIPQGAYVRLMKANMDRLIDGAVKAANTTLEPFNKLKCEWAILISCVGRKLVLKQMVEEEVEGVRSVLGKEAALTGFYSYGEISPFSMDATCELHNQTMTITAFAES
jgi:hypothetical protein